MTQFNNMAEVKAANEAIGHHWFSKDTMRFFESRIETELIGHRYFVSSEQSPYGPRQYAIRQVNDNGSIETVGDEPAGKWFSTRQEAVARAKELAEEWMYHPMNGE